MKFKEESIFVYGFGSYFKTTTQFNDIDLLIIHEDLTRDSCDAAIALKKEFYLISDCYHINLLSTAEERSLDFLSKCKAVLLGNVKEPNGRDEIDRIVRRIESYRSG